MEFFTTKHINELIKDEYISFISNYYADILSNPNKYISITENKISDYLWWGYVKLVNSWTTALQFWLLALWVEKGDEIILPANTYSATAISITNIWAIPIFVDINLDNYTIDYNDLENKITSKTKVIIPVHIYGYNCYMKEIIDIAYKHWIKLLEDASHAFWWEYCWKKLWTIWDVWAFSCHLSKNYWTFGNGWIFFTKDKNIYDKLNNYIYPDTKNMDVLKSLRTPANIWVMDSIVLLLKLKYIDKIIDRNISTYKLYLEIYKDYDFDFPKLDLINNKLHIRNFTVLSKNRNELIKNWLWCQYYDVNLNISDTFRNVNSIILKNTEIFFRYNLSLNFYYWIKNKT